MAKNYMQPGQSIFLHKGPNGEEYLVDSQGKRFDYRTREELGMPPISEATSILESDETGASPLVESFEGLGLSAEEALEASKH